MPMTANQKARVLIVDDHPVLREGMRRLIGDEMDMEVVAEAEGMSDGLREVRSTSPDLVIVDISLKDGHGLELIKELRARDDAPKMLVVSMHEEPHYAERALHAGAHGYVPKSEAPATIVEAIRQVLRGEFYLNRAMSTRLLHGFARGVTAGKSPEESLSDRELQVFELLGQGLSSREVSARLMLSVKTVDTYREHIKEKLSLKNGNELLVRAVLWAHAERV